MLISWSFDKSNMATMRIGFVKYFLFLGALTLSQDFCVGELFITHSPKHTKFLEDAGAIDLSEVSKVMVSSFGLGLNKDLKWNGVSQRNIFKRPKAHCIVSVEGFEDGSIRPENIATYQVNNDIGAVNTDLISQRLMRSTQQGSFVVDFSQYSRIYDVRSQYPEILKDVPSSFSSMRAIFTQDDADVMSLNFASLNISQQADLGFLSEIVMLRSVIKAMKSNPGIAGDAFPDFIHFKVTTIPELIHEYGQESDKVKDAVAMLQNVLNELTNDLRTLYNDNVVVEVATFVNDMPGQHRNVRSLLQDDKEDNPAVKTVQQIHNVASGYKDNYAVYFNLILWLVVVLILAIVFISYGIWFMDPGRDSIIYRMTSQRLKRE